jgi:hypothetical protein
MSAPYPIVFSRIRKTLELKQCRPIDLARLEFVYNRHSVFPSLLSFGHQNTCCCFPKDGNIPLMFNLFPLLKIRAKPGYVSREEEIMDTLQPVQGRGWYLHHLTCDAERVDIKSLSSSHIDICFCSLPSVGNTKEYMLPSLNNCVFEDYSVMLMFELSLSDIPCAIKASDESLAV